MVVIKQLFALYRIDIACLLMVFTLTACVLVPPDQQMSEAKQALQSADTLVTEQSNEALKSEYLAAETALLQAEVAMKNKDYAQAKQLIAESKRLSQGILKQQRQDDSE